jgi:hypothetical protein
VHLGEQPVRCLVPAGTGRQENKESVTTSQYPYGSVKQAVIELIGQVPEGSEFYYGDIADELNLQRPTVSGIVLAMARAANPVVVHGSRSGHYRRVRPSPGPRQEPELAQPEQGPSSPVGEAMEVVGIRQNGNRILRGKDNSVWEATQM